jgi:ubiquinone/menaquinone biosynthesis C-methylase UbiE
VLSWYEDHIFPKVLDWATRPLNRDRQQLISQAQGKVLEIGVGNGANFPFYQPSATEVHGIEPGEALLTEARKAAYACQHPEKFHLINAGAEKLPWPDHHFDTVVACLVFCTIPDYQAAAKEVFRVLKPGGSLLVLEHVAHARPGWRRTQKIIEPLWTPLACGCHLSRDSKTLFSSAGFDVSGLNHWQHPKIPTFAGYMLSGKALRPA